MKELIYKINHEENFDKAQGMLEMLNAVYGTKFDFLGGRVVRFDNPEASTAEKYAHCHDAWATVKEEIEMKNYTVTTRENLRTLCIAHQWFTCGSCEQYEKMFYANENGCPIEEIATIIWLCSDENWCRRDILSILTDERRSYLRATRG